MSAFSPFPPDLSDSRSLPPNADDSPAAATDETHVVVADAPKVTLWRRLGGGPLSISILTHAILLVIGVSWVIRSLPSEESTRGFTQKGGGGGASGERNLTNKKRASMVSVDTPRVVAEGASSIFTLPEPDAASSLTSVEVLSGGIPGGLDGTGNGASRGNGTGDIFGDGRGPGPGIGSGGQPPFGIPGLPNRGALVGSFYDTKQTPDKMPTNLDETQFLEVVSDFVKKGWNEDEFGNKYYKAPTSLSLSRIYITSIDASAAPKAFGADKDVKPSRWVVVYRGMISPPKTGRYRFVGTADDMIAVRFDGKAVFDGGYYSAYLGQTIHGATARVLAGKEENRALKKELRSHYRMPVTFYPYPTAQGYNNFMGGLMAGHWFEAKEGNFYPIEILVSEIPGSVFGACLLIENGGARYKKLENGSPILPLFRIDDTIPEPQKDKSYFAPEFDPNGPIWKVSSLRPAI